VLLPLLLADRQERDAVADRGVADRDVERVEGCQRRVQRRPVADVGLDVRDLAVQLRPL
jgi:hypothetical protein